jgi:hypothetical protein
VALYLSAELKPGESVAVACVSDTLCLTVSSGKRTVSERVPAQSARSSDFDIVTVRLRAMLQRARDLKIRTA